MPGIRWTGWQSVSRSDLSTVTSWGKDRGVGRDAGVGCADREAPGAERAREGGGAAAGEAGGELVGVLEDLGEEGLVGGEEVAVEVVHGRDCMVFVRFNNVTVQSPVEF
jgi:hypothetical protein